MDMDTPLRNGTAQATWALGELNRLKRATGTVLQQRERLELVYMQDKFRLAQLCDRHELLERSARDIEAEGRNSEHRMARSVELLKKQGPQPQCHIDLRSLDESILDNSDLAELQCAQEATQRTEKEFHDLKLEICAMGDTVDPDEALKAIWSKMLLSYSDKYETALAAHRQLKQQAAALEEQLSHLLIVA